MDYRFFIDPKMKASKYLVYKCDSLPVEMHLTADKMHANTYEHYNFCIEKHKTMNLIQIRLSNIRDNTSVFICTIDDTKFEHFKIEQSLYVTFESFVNHITEMVEKCRQKQMNVRLTMINDGFTTTKEQQRFRLQFYEKGTLKNLEHISLPIESAPYEVILFHINQTYAYSQEENRIIMQKNNNLQLELAQKDDQIDLLNGVINGLKHNLNEQEKILKERFKEQTNRFEIEIKELNDAKNYQTQEFEKQIIAFKARIETLMKENYTINEQFQLEQKQTAKLRADGKKALNTITTLNQQLDQLNAERLNQQNSAQKYDKNVADLRQQINDLEQKIMMHKKQKQELLAELEAERNICQIKKDGLKMATEDICNANTIIRKQATEIDVLRKKVELRTEVALKQEQLLRESSRGKENVGNVMERIDDALKQNAEQCKDTENRIKSIRDRTNFIESKYRDRIDDLYDRICTISPNTQPNSKNGFDFGY